VTLDSRESGLILENADSRARLVGGQQLGMMLCDRRSVRLVVLNACATAPTPSEDPPLTGIATCLMEYGVPAVVAMQFAMTDESAQTFADEFYRAVASGDAVDTAVTRARRVLAAQSDVEWATPALFMRVADGRLFDVKDIHH
jgi:CHAT domain-containing protein